MALPAYYVFDVKIHDPERIKPYQAAVAETLKAFGGERLVVGGRPEAVEGDIPHGMLVIVRFPSLEHARAWHDSPAYQAIIGYRLAAADTNAYLVEGFDAPSGITANT